MLHTVRVMVSVLSGVSCMACGMHEQTHGSYLVGLLLVVIGFFILIFAVLQHFSPELKS